MLGLDPGERRVGVALSDAGGVIASPHSVIDTRSTDPVAAVVEICAEHDVQTIVVGLAVSLSGEEGAAAVAAREFGSLVSEATGGNLVYWDERFTSVQAEQALLESGMRRDKRRETRDKVAASFMLQGYLDSVNAGER